MRRILRVATILLLVGAGSSSAALARVHRGGHLPPGCTSPADSALNQYCELIPNAGGGQTPKAGTPAVATALPRSVEQRIAAAPSASPSRRLLTLPAAAPRRPARRAGGPQRTHPAPTNAAHVSGSSLPLWLFLVLAALAVALVGATIARRQRARGSGPGGDTVP